MKIVFGIASLLLTCVTSGETFYAGSNQIVGFVKCEVKQGLNEIKITMESLDIFPTLAKTVRFEPSANVVGDELIFDLDGKRYRYLVESYDGTNAVLTTKMQFAPKKIGLDWIPIRDRMWLDHKTAKQLALSNVGQISESQTRSGVPMPGAMNREIEITLVGDSDEKNKILFRK